MTSPPTDAPALPASAGVSSWPELAAALEPALAQAAGPDAVLMSVSLDLGRSAARPWTVSARLERGARTLAFVYGQVVAADGALAATASAVFSRG